MYTVIEIIKEYEKLLNKNFVYTLENGVVIDLVFTKANLPHLLGLQYLEDIPMLKEYKEKIRSANFIYRMLKIGDITDEQIKNSIHFNKIENRFNHIINIQALCCNKLIYNFNNSLANSEIIADMLLYKLDTPFQLHLFIKHKYNDTNVNRHAPVSFFNRYSEQYILGQQKLKVIDFKIIDK